MQIEPPKADPPKRRRRWFQFSLRTLMIGVTHLAMACGYAGWQMKIVRERRAWAISHQHWFADHSSKNLRVLSYADPACFPSRIRLWLGDEAIEVLLVPNSITPAELDLAVSLFPEARIVGEDWGS